MSASIRRSHRRRLLGSFWTIVGMVLVLFPAAPGGAVSPIQTGWWQRDNPLASDDVTAQGVADAVVVDAAAFGQITVPTAPPLPIPPPTVPPVVTIPPVIDPPVNVPPPVPIPDGGLFVANDSFGAAAVSALRFDGTEVGGGTLVLDVASSTPLPVDGFEACPVNAQINWTQTADGAWRDRPAHDCDRLGTTGLVSEDGQQITFNLPGVFKAESVSYLDVMIMPARGNGTPFQVVFDAPTDASLIDVVAPPAETPASIPDPLTPEELAALPPPPQDFIAPESFDAVPGVAPPPTEVVEFTQSSESGGFVPPALRRFVENPTVRRIATLLAFGLAVGYYYLSSRPSRPPRLLGTFATVEVAQAEALKVAQRIDRPRGIGRFTSYRTAPPSRLQ